MTTVFLDIDGVLATDASYARWEKLKGYLGLKNESFDKLPLAVLSVLFDPECLFLVRLLITATQAQVIVSSSWRELLPEARLRELLAVHRIIVAGVTPVRHVPFKYNDAKLVQHRGAEVHEVIVQRRLDPKSCVILEDAEDVFPYNARRVQSSEKYGFERSHLKRALVLLGWEPARAQTFIEGALLARQISA